MLGKQFRRDQFIWLMQWAIAGSNKLEKTRFGVILLEQEAWKVLAHWVDEAWRVFYYSCVPTLFFSGLLTA